MVLSCSVYAPAYQILFSTSDELSKYPVYALGLGLEGKAVQFTQTDEMEIRAFLSSNANSSPLLRPNRFWLSAHNEPRLPMRDEEEDDGFLPLCQNAPPLRCFSGIDRVRYLKAPRTYSGPTHVVPFCETARCKGRSLSILSVEASDRRPANARVSE